MATNWRDIYATCPFYLSTSGNRMAINCQGVADSSVLSWRFKSKEDLNIQFKTFCSCKYQNCEVYQMLKAIYEEE